MQTPKVLGQSNPTINVLTNIYTVPAVTNTIISSIFICNQDVVGSSFSISIAVAGAINSPKQYIYSGTALSANDTFETTSGISLAAGDIVRVLATTSNVSFSLFGIEIQ